ncbi:MAG: cation-translocating P-type ATPase [Armatimonadetes bacterium]|nr:cation-translocating P-type ATPase [Armatimonadota bacterium]
MSDALLEPQAVRRRLRGALAGLVLLINSWLARWVYPDNPLAAELSAGLAAVVLAVPIVVRAARDLLAGRRSIHELVALGALAAFVQNDLRIAAAVSFFLQIGQLIESHSAVGARQDVEAVLRLAPQRAVKVTDGGEVELPAAELKPGDLVRVRAGDSIPADGVVEGGVSTVDQASITGESLPVDCRAGSEVFAGTANLTGLLEIRVTRAGSDTTLGRVRELILQAERTRLPVQRAIDRYAGAYTPVVLMIAGLVWFFARDPSAVVAVLVVAVPGALVLAAPSAVVAALSAAARLGVLIKDVAQLETAARVDAWLFDKTGTLTTGALAVAQLQPLGGLTPAELVRRARGPAPGGGGAGAAGG